MSKRILVFGGLGFIGANFVRWAVENRPDYELRVVDGFTYAADVSRLPREFGGQIIRAMLDEKSKYKSHVGWSDVVVNFAAETHNDNSLANPGVFVKSNVLGTAALLDVCKELGRGLLQVSTDEVFGDFPLGSKTLATESSPFRPSSPYSSTKAAADLLVMAWERSFGLEAMVTHCTNNFGPGQNKEKLIPNVLAKIGQGLPIELYGDGKNVRDWIHVDDHSRALSILIDSPQWGESFNISSNDELSNLGLVSLILEKLGLTGYPIEFVRDRPGHDLRYGLDSTKIRNLGWSPRLLIRDSDISDINS